MRRRQFVTTALLAATATFIPAFQSVRARVVRLAQGTFRDGDPVHRGPGSFPYRERGCAIQRLWLHPQMSEMQITPGPSLFVNLAAEPDPLFPRMCLPGSIHWASSRA
tara:strand:+ start:575 stop:898 length:324 start_codon:yes stop_codon:yes gene_type:complete